MRLPLQQLDQAAVADRNAGYKDGTDALDGFPHPDLMDHGSMELILVDALTGVPHERFQSSNLTGTNEIHRLPANPILPSASVAVQDEEWLYSFFCSITK